MFSRSFYYDPIDINSKRTTLMVMVFAAVGYTFLLLMPSILGAFVEELGYSGEVAGEIASANMLGVAIASVVGFITLPYWNLRMVALGSLVSLIFIDLATAYTSSPEYMFWVRFVAGLGTGMLAVILVSVVSGTQKPERIFAFLMLAQFLFSAVAFQFLPVLFEGYGLRELFLILAVATTLSLPLVRYASVYPQSTEQSNDVSSSQESSSQESSSQKSSDKKNRHKKSSIIKLLTPMALLGLASTLAFYASGGGAWAYTELIGERAVNVSESSVSTALSSAMIVSIFAAGLAAVIALKFGRMIPLTLGVSIAGLSIFMMNSELNNSAFILYVCSFNAAYCFVGAYYMGFFAWLDPSGRLNAINNFFMFLGLGLGPYVGGSLIAEDGSFELTINALALSSFIAIILMWMVYAIFRLKKKSFKAAL